MSKMLVTGGTGFTGSALVKRLISKGNEVIVLDNQKGIMHDDLVKLGAKISIGSIADKELVTKCVAGCDVIFHLAAAFRKVNLPKSVYYDTNVTAMRQLLEICKAENVKKVVYCSTQGVHGNVDNPPGDETTPIEPEDYYQVTKYQGEEVAQEFIKDGMDITILRPTAIYGPGDPGRFLMLFKRVKSGMFPFFGNGQALYHPLYIENFVDAFELAAEKPEGKGETYLIADEKFYHIKEIVILIDKIMKTNAKIKYFPFWPLYAVATVVEILYKPLPWDPPIFRRRADWFRQNRAFKIDKAKNELGYNPKVGLEEGLTKTYEWYRDNGYLGEALAKLSADTF